MNLNKQVLIHQPFLHWVHCIMANLVGFWIVVSRIDASLSVMPYYFPFIVGIILFMSRNVDIAKSKEQNLIPKTYKAIVLQRTQQSTLQETLLLESWNSCTKAYLKILRSKGVSWVLLYPSIWLVNIKTKGFTSQKSFGGSGGKTFQAERGSDCK